MNQQNSATGGYQSSNVSTNHKESYVVAQIHVEHMQDDIDDDSDVGLDGQGRHRFSQGNEMEPHTRFPGNCEVKRFTKICRYSPGKLQRMASTTRTSTTCRVVYLLDKVVELGDLGEIVKVKGGYAREKLADAHDRHRLRSGSISPMLERWAAQRVKKRDSRSKPHENWKSRKVTHDFPPYFHPISPGYPQRYPT